MLTSLVGGIITGLLYGVTGLGLVVIYRTSKVLNFAMGGIGALAAYVAGDLLGQQIPYWLAFPVAVLFAGVLGGVIELTIARPLARRPPITIGIATLGALLVLEGLLGLRYGFLAKALKPAFGDQGSLHAGALVLSANQVFVVVAGVLATLLLFWVLHRTKLGLSMRATSSGPYTSEVLGVNISRVRLASWVIGGAYGGLAGLLVTPMGSLAPDSFTMFLLATFTAVVIGGFTSMVGVMVGAIVFGVAVNLLVIYLDPNLITVYTLIVVTLVLVFRPHGVLGQREHEMSEPELASSHSGIDLGSTARRGAGESGRGLAGPSERTLWRAMRTWMGYAIGAVLLITLPFWTSANTVYQWGTVVAVFVGILGLNVLVGYSGQVSIANGAFLAIGAYVGAILISHGIPTIIAVVLAGAAGALGGFLLGLPATRLSGIYLMMLTLIFAAAVPQLILRLDGLTGGASGLPFAAPESFLASQNALYWFVLAVAILVTVAIVLAADGRLSRGWRAVRDSEPGASTLGIRPASVKLGAFTIGSTLTALSGALMALMVGFVGPDNYGIFVGITALLAVILGGSGSVFGSFLGAMFIVLVPTYTVRTSIPQNLMFGVLLLIVLLFAPRGIAGLLSSAVQWCQGTYRARRLGSATAHAPSAAPDVADDVVPTLHVAADPDQSPPLLEVRGLTAGYGHNVVLNSIDLAIRPGEVVALLGANGAGKSTLLRTISGALACTEGAVYWSGKRIPHTPHRVARVGISHVPEGRGIFPDLTVKENLMMGTFGSGTKPSTDDWARVYEHFPLLKERMEQRAGTLSGGQQQMLAIGRALLGRPRLLMLDEPSLGLAPVIREQVFEILRDIAGLGVSILLVEQDAEAALDLADRAYVLRRGRVMFDGPAVEMRKDARLHQAYLAVEA